MNSICELHPLPPSIRWDSGLGQFSRMACWPLLFILGTLSAFAAGTNAVPASFHSGWWPAWAAAEEDGALVLAIFEASWCGPCRLLKQRTLGDETFRNRAGPLHVVQLDVDAESARANEFSVQAIPDLVLLTAERKIVARRKGFVSTQDLLDWLAEGRRRAAAGVWEGTVARSELETTLEKLRTGLAKEDEPRLLELLASADPSVRQPAVRRVVELRERAMPFLIAATGHEYLGVRLAAVEALEKLIQQVPAVDPWAAPAERQQSVAALQKWWAETRALPKPAARTLAVDDLRSATRALEALAGNDPVERTRALSALVQLGPGALPQVRDAIKRSERAGDQKTVTVLEDVRWTLLVPDDLERRWAGTRRTLARGTSPDRQAAAVRLGQARTAALPALAELVNDPDPLVKESALRALASVGGADVIPAMATLLKAADSNLRMTAAQTLGKTKKREAAEHLVTVLDDPNEVVVCAAIAALEEVKAKDREPELARCLSDTRWRVRAAAAEVIGKLELRGTAGAVRKLLQDPDGFVVKEALTALPKVGSRPTTEELVAVTRRLPGLKRLGVEMLAGSGDSPEIAGTVTALYQESDAAGRVEILTAVTGESEDRFIMNLARGEESRTVTNHWRPLIEMAVAAPDGQQRALAVELVSRRAPELAEEFLGPLLEDTEPVVRQAAAKLVVGVAVHHWGVGSDDQKRDFGIFNKTNQTKRAQLLRDKHTQWHAALGKHPVALADFPVAVAFYATGDGRDGLEALAKAAASPVKDESVNACEPNKAIGLVMRRLPWPQSQAVVEQMCRNPAHLGPLLTYLGSADAGVRDFVLEPERLVQAISVEVSEPTSQSTIFNALVQKVAPIWKQTNQTDRASATLKRLAASGSGRLRALTAYLLGRWGDEATGQLLETLSRDPDPWVRRNAVAALMRREPDVSRLQERLATFLSDTNEVVVAMAATGLVQPEIREAAGVRFAQEMFRYSDVWAGSYESWSSRSDDRPLTTLGAPPPFVEPARRWLARTDIKLQDETRQMLMLLLAQYGDFAELDRVSRDWMTYQSSEDGGATDVPGPILVGIALSKDVKYLPFLRQAMDATDEESGLRNLLKALRGMSGEEVRKLRVAINRKMKE